MRARLLCPVGARFSALTVVGEAPPSTVPGDRRRSTRQWRVRCACGAALVVGANALRHGEVRHCGCRARAPGGRPLSAEERADLRHRAVRAGSVRALSRSTGVARATLDRALAGGLVQRAVVARLFGPAAVPAPEAPPAARRAAASLCPGCAGALAHDGPLVYCRDRAGCGWLHLTTQRDRDPRRDADEPDADGEEAAS